MLKNNECLLIYLKDETLITQRSMQVSGVLPTQRKGNGVFLYFVICTPYYDVPESPVTAWVFDSFR